MDQPYSSALLEKAVDEFAKLPGIGRKTAMRLALHLLKLTPEDVEQFASSVSRLRRDIRYCRVCHNISDEDVCAICSKPSRDGSVVCVVENFQDVLAIEATTQFHGLYHVLGGVISPLDGVGPSQLEIDSLVQRVAEGGVQEVILALGATMEGDTTNFYIYQKLKGFEPVHITTLARGISVNDELQYTDELTLGRAIVQRIPYTK